MKYFLMVAALVCMACGAGAQGPRTRSCSTAGTDNAFLGITTIPLWSSAAPAAKGNTCYDIPTLTIFPPVAGSANGSAVVIFPGGGYEVLAGDLEGRDIASWFAARGFTAFIVSYRLPAHGYMLPIPLLDARRAIQDVRAHAAQYHIVPNRIVAIGFSAGGHLAALAATKPVSGNPGSPDPVERVSSRPDYLVLGYPWLGAITTNFSHLSYCRLFHVPDNTCNVLKAKYSPSLLVNRDTPPTFLYHTYNDQTVPIEQSLEFVNALVKAGVPAEIHIFANGSHGSGLGKGNAALDQWPGLLETWLRAQGLLTANRTAVAAQH